VLTDPPSNGLQAKFNLRFCLAMAMMGIDTSDPASFSAETASRQDVHNLAQSIEIRIDPAIPFEAARLDITLVDGSKISAYRDAGVPEVDLDALSASVESKARRLLSALPEPERERLIKSFRDIPSLTDMKKLHPAISAVGSRSTIHE
jgi:2-methylcitrate dehydratase PrpD